MYRQLWLSIPSRTKTCTAQRMALTASANHALEMVTNVWRLAQAALPLSQRIWICWLSDIGSSISSLTVRLT